MTHSRFQTIFLLGLLFVMIVLTGCQEKNATYYELEQLLNE